MTRAWLAPELPDDADRSAQHWAGEHWAGEHWAGEHGAGDGPALVCSECGRVAEPGDDRAWRARAAIRTDQHRG